jgi:hypothetical protein
MRTIEELMNRDREIELPKQEYDKLICYLECSSPGDGIDWDEFLDKLLPTVNDENWREIKKGLEDRFGEFLV